MLLNSNNTPTKQLGCVGEQFVARALVQDGFAILAFNYTTKLGEVDVIAQKNEIIAFVEVKTRRHAYFHVSQVVTSAKQKKIIKAAQYFIMERRLKECIYRFDVALVDMSTSEPVLTYIPNAFTKQSW